MNNKIINILTLQLNEYKKDPSKRWKSKALQKAIYTIKEYPSIINSGKDIESLKGIGKGMVKRVDEIIQTGTIKGLNIESKNDNNQNYFDKINKLKEITGVGDSRAKSWIKSGINNINDVFKAKKEGILKTTHHIDIGLKYFYDFQKRIPRKEITKMQEIIKKSVKKVNIDLIFEICGSYRRGLNDSGDIDILITNPFVEGDIEKQKYLSKLVRELKKVNFIIDDLTKSGQKKYMGVCKLQAKLPARRIDIRCVNYDEYYAAILYFTGSKNFNVLMRQNAIDMNYSLNEYGLKNKETNEIIKLKSEQDLFKILEVPYIKPTERIM